ncbi:hypothetical protein [Streptomyces goshikiensis]|uniref:hypothetical protein n=1 Tax=Streptomyces goshikiensis TaxID=1942 RepID=UPI00332BA98B
MTDENPFPHDLLQLQEYLHRAHAEHRTYLAGLHWSVEPMKGWARGERYYHRGDVPDSPGWSDEQKETVDRMWAEIRQLSPCTSAGTSTYTSAATNPAKPHWPAPARSACSLNA